MQTAISYEITLAKPDREVAVELFFIVLGSGKIPFLFEVQIKIFKLNLRQRIATEQIRLLSLIEMIK